LRHTWKDSNSALQEELKNISYESRIKKTENRIGNLNLNYKSNQELIGKISGQFEEFMEKFEVSYFNCTNLTGGHFVIKESENVFVFCLSNLKWKLKEFYSKLSLSWQRKNVFIQLHPDSYKDFCENQNDPKKENGFNYFPVTNLRDSDQLARTLCHANIYNSFETPNMELLGKGGLVDFVISSDDKVKHLGLLRPNFLGKAKWPIPNNLTEDSWSYPKPKLIINIKPTIELENIPKIGFDDYIAYSPDIDIFSAFFLQQIDGKQSFILSIKCKLGDIPFGYGEMERNSNLFKVYVGPFNFPQLNRVIFGVETFTKYLQLIPQYYEYFLHNNLGESKWNELCRQGLRGSWLNEFPIPDGLIKSKNNFKASWRQKSKNDLSLLVERAENSHKLRTSKRQSSYHPIVFPSLSHLQSDSNHLNRLQSKFKNSLQVFLSSCDAQMGCSLAFSQFQLPQVLFKHSLPIHQMTDFSEALQKKRAALRPLFNENERDLFHILKEMPVLKDEMAAANFVSGDIFGNPYKKERKTREISKMAIKRSTSPFKNSLPTDESDLESENQNQIMSPMSIIDEIDYKEIEDIENEIVLNGSIVNLPILPPSSNDESGQINKIELSNIQKWIKSPGGLDAKTKLIESLPIISDLNELINLLNLSKRFKRVKLSALISERIEKI
jgi:hypothetical protein